MAYNLQPLIQILEHILHPHHNNWILDPSTKPIVESLLGKARFVEEFFENPLLSITGHDVGTLESRIRDAAYYAQYLIESHLADLLLSQTKGGSIFISPPHNLLQRLEGCEFEHILGEIRKITDASDASSSVLVSSRQSLSTMQDLNPRNIAVGISEDLEQLKDQLMMDPKSKLEVIPIVGMGGMGKTTLARTLYDDKSVVLHFDMRAWIVVSESYDVRGILLGILKCIIGVLVLPDKIINDPDIDISLRLYKKLWGRRYLIVLDDMWSIEAWDCISHSFPDENNGSRILVTTREEGVANKVADSTNLHHQMKLLNDAKCWELLCKKVFPDGCWESELEEIGRNIAKACGGLPLAIHVIGGVLSRLEKNRNAWRRVAKDVRSLVNSDEQVSNILSLSYNHLPNYLKPCFLYLSAFPNDRQIQASEVIWLWMAEGFLKPISGMSFEETGRAYLKELVERNLLSIGKQETKRNVKSYIMHDLLRDLCIRKAQEEKFLYAGIQAITDSNPKEILRLRLTSYDRFKHIIESLGKRSYPFVHSILFIGGTGDHELSSLDTAFGGLHLLKVLDMLAVAVVEDLPTTIERLFSLRYLAAHISNTYPFSLANLLNLQTLIFHLHGGNLFDGKVKELLDMSQLRHVKFKGEKFPRFVLKDGESVNDIVHKELQTLSMVEIDKSILSILKAIPNLKKLGIHLRESSSFSMTIDLSLLSELQILKCSQSLLSWRSFDLIFPLSLKKLTLHEYGIINNGFLNKIGHLPNLQVLKVRDSLLWEGNNLMLMGVWEATEGEFQQLRVLLLKNFRGLKKWIVDETHYPRLEHLIVDGCYELEEIPSGIGDISTLETIEVKGFTATCALESAKKIQEEQSQFGNDTLQVITSEVRLGY